MNAYNSCGTKVLYVCINKTANCSKECSLGFGSLSKYLIAALFHKPLGGTGGSADANGVYIPEPFHVYLVGTLHLVRVRITLRHSWNRTFPLELFRPATKRTRSCFAANNEMFGIRLATCRQMVSKLRNLAFSEICSCIYSMIRWKLVQALRCLWIKIYIAVEIELLHIFKLFYHNGVAMRLTHQTQYFGMSGLAKDNDLWCGCFLPNLSTPFPSLPFQGRTQRYCRFFRIDL